MGGRREVGRAPPTPCPPRPPWTTQKLSQPKVLTESGLRSPLSCKVPPMEVGLPFRDFTYPRPAAGRPHRGRKRAQEEARPGPQSGSWRQEKPHPASLSCALTLLPCLPGPTPPEARGEEPVESLHSQPAGQRSLEKGRVWVWRWGEAVGPSSATRWAPLLHAPPDPGTCLPRTERDV